MNLNALGGGVMPKALSSVINMPTNSSGRILSSRNGLTWRDLGGQVYTPSQPYRMAFYQGWHYFGLGSDVIKTKDFINFQTLTGVVRNKYNNNSMLLPQIVCTANGVFYQLALFNGTTLELLKSIDSCQTWNNAGLIQGSLVNIIEVYGIVLGLTKMAITFCASLTTREDRFAVYCSINGGVFGQYIQGTLISQRYSLPESSIFANGVYYFTALDNALHFIEESNLITDTTQSNVIILPNFEGESAALGYSTQTNTVIVACARYQAGSRSRELDIFYKQGNNAFIKSTIPATTIIKQHLSCIGLKNGGFALSYRTPTDAFSSEGDGGILHSPDGITWTQVVPEGQYQYLGGLFNVGANS